MRIRPRRKRRVKVDTIQPLQALGIRHKTRLTDQRVNPPLLRAYIARIQHCLALALDQKHHRPGTVVGIEEGNAYSIARGELEVGGRVEGDRPEQFLQVAVCLFAGFEDAFGEVHAVGVFL